VLALPPPMYRQEEPRSKVFVVQAASESISPENGAPAGLEKPAPPQAVVPAAVVYLSDMAPMVVVVVLDVVVVAIVLVVDAAVDVVVVAIVLVVDAAVDVVVVAGAVDVVVVAAPVVEVVAAPVVEVVAAPVVEVVAAPVVEVVAAPVVVVVVEDERQGLCAQETAPRDVPPCLSQLFCVNCPHAGAPCSLKQQATLFVGFAAMAFMGTNTTASSTPRTPRITVARSAFRMTASVYRGDEVRAGLVEHADKNTRIPLLPNDRQYPQKGKRAVSA